MIRLRKPKADDHTIIQLIRKELVPLSQHLLSDSSTKTSSLLKRLAKGKTYVHVDSRNKTNGFITVRRKKHLLYIDMLAVKSKHKGQGIGSKLLRRAEQDGWSKGCQEIQLFINDENKAANHFYVKNGYDILDYHFAIRCYLLGKSKDLKVIR